MGQLLFLLSGNKEVVQGRWSAPSQPRPEPGRAKREERISGERMWLLVELIVESCELGMGEKAAKFSRKGSCGSVLQYKLGCF